MHRYFFRLFALDVDRLDLPERFTAGDVFRAMHAHVLAEASVHGNYSLHPDNAATPSSVGWVEPQVKPLVSMTPDDGFSCAIPIIHTLSQPAPTRPPCRERPRTTTTPPPPARTGRNS